MLAVNFHLMGGMPNRAHLLRAEPVATTTGDAPLARHSDAAAAEVSAGLEPRAEAPPEVTLRRPIALGVLLAKVRENLL
jgi:hypothetical protein